MVFLKESMHIIAERELGYSRKGAVANKNSITYFAAKRNESCEENLVPYNICDFDSIFDATVGAQLGKGGGNAAASDVAIGGWNCGG